MAAPSGLQALEIQFANDVGKATGIDPRVIYAQEQAEGAYAPGGTGGLNFLNLRPYSSDVGVTGQSKGGFDQFSTLQAAEVSTEKRLSQSFLQSFLGPVLGSSNPTPAAEIYAIGQSGWDAGHYGSPPGSKLASIFSGLYGSAALSRPAIQSSHPQVTPNITPGVTQLGIGGGVTQDAGFWGNFFGTGPGTTATVTGVFSSLTEPFVRIYDLLQTFAVWLKHFVSILANPNTWIRLGLVILGAIIVLGGLFALVKG